MRPPSERLVNGRGGWLGSGCMVAHCVLVETDDGLVLIDAGFGTKDIRDPRGRLTTGFVAMVRPVLDEAETALRQVEALGYQARDVRHIVVTHLDVDHAGGLSDFPDATVHVYRREHDAAMRPRSYTERTRYRACHWAHGPKWELHDDDGEQFMGLGAVRAIVEPEVLLVPTTGHSRGHAAVAIASRDGWLLHCGDAYFNKNELNHPPTCPAGLRLFQTMAATSNEERIQNQERLRELRRQNRNDVTLFSAHDGDELAMFRN